MQELLIQSLEIDWSEIDARDYLRSIHAIQAIERLEFHSPVTFFAGENGSGKSTLLEAIAVAQGFNPEGGTKNYSFSTYDSHSGLAEALRLVRGARRAKWGYFLRAESFYNVATQEENYAELQCLSAGYHRKSHGESFLALAQQEFHPQGLYLLDEPMGGVDPAARDYILDTIITNYNQEGSILISTHLISDIENILDDVIMIKEGNVVCYDSADNIRMNYEKSLDQVFREVFRC